MKASDFKIKTHAGNSAVGGYWASISGPGDFFELIGVPHTKDSFETRRQVIAAAHARIGEVIEDADNK